ncbi:hypothetical protein BDN71DRAFT_1443303 [Pleurotus eryngii]|uniref:Uncharacterized protein n=1 Tax=Pleurotus eryngii TaxID=5323 RepID=A0A9P6A589_PLEER|nr:hypothetical protein BDN71DRAFT_1443303 [Pleurotus eryngii]
MFNRHNSIAPGRYALHGWHDHQTHDNVESTMYDTKPGQGVLNERDMRHPTALHASLGCECVGMPFLVLDLLTCLVGDIRSYRHDCDSFQVGRTMA